MEIILPGKAWKARKFGEVRFELLLAKKDGLMEISLGCYIFKTYFPSSSQIKFVICQNPSSLIN